MPGLNCGRAQERSLHVGAVKRLAMEVAGREEGKAVREEAGKDRVLIQDVPLLPSVREHVPV